MNISTNEHVYEPAEDSYLLINALRNVGDISGLSLCDMGCGTGTVGLHAAARGASVTLVDSNPAAVALARTNTTRNRIDARVVHSDLFSNVPDTFDIIVSNPPYLPADRAEPDDVITRSLVGGKHGYEWTARLLSEAREHLQPNGVLVFIVSSLSKPDVLHTHITANGFSHTIVATQHMGGFETLSVYLCQFLPGIRDARKMGYRTLVEIARGKRGIVYHNGNDIVIKIKREDAAISTLEHEATMLRRVNAFNIGPRYIDHTPHCLVMAYIRGISLKKALPAFDAGQRITIIKQLLDQATLLDTHGIAKAEMTRPHNNVLVSENLTVTLVDFERSRMAEKPNSLRQLAQFIIRISTMPDTVAKMIREKSADYQAGIIDAKTFATIMLDTFIKHNI